MSNKEYLYENEMTHIFFNLIKIVCSNLVLIM